MARSQEWVVNASPIISLSLIGQAELLIGLCERVVVPRAVQQEVLAGADLPGQALFSLNQVEIIDVTDDEKVLAWDLGAGETAVLSYAIRNQGAVAVLDDRAARRCARSFDVPHLGTLTVVILAQKRGLTPSAKYLLRAMVDAGMRLDEATIRRVLREALNETW